MPKYHLSYSGGGPMAEDDEARAAVMQAWDNWYTELGAAVVDPGAPFGARRSIAPDGSVRDGGGLTGYTILDAADLTDAATRAKGCPVLADGGAIEVSECLEM